MKMFPNLNNLPEEGDMRSILKDAFPRMNKRQKKILKVTIKMLKRTKRISQAQYDDAMKEFEDFEKGVKNG